MDTRLGDELRAVLQSAVAFLNVGRWGDVLGDAGTAATAPGGPGHLVRLLVTLEHIANAMRLRDEGFLVEAWAACEVAATSLPPNLRGVMPAGVLAQLVEPPPAHDVDAHLGWWASRLVYREQYELDDLRRRFAHDRATPRDELIEAYIEYLGAAVRVDVSRGALLDRATRLRQFVGSTRGDVSQSVWTDAGNRDCLHALALRELAERLSPAPWYGQPGTADLPVCLNRLRAWCLNRPRPSSAVG